MNKFIIDDTESNIRIDSYLANLLEGFSRTKIQSLIKSNNVLINDKPCKPSQIIKQDDIVTCDTTILEDITPIAQDLDIEIVYNDENIAIVNKPSGMLTHPTSTQKTDTLVNALLHKFNGQLSDINGKFRAGIVHRLDKNTSGLLIIAKNNIAHTKIAQMIKDREIEKRYRAIVKGVIEQNIIVNEPIGRSKTNPTKMDVTPDGKPSLTEVYLLKQFKDATYLDINLKTGRTHQIRVHLSHIGHPIFNDTLYGFGKQKIKTDEQVLQSYKLKFTNPFSDEIIDIEIEPDEKINRVLKYLENK